MSTQDIYNYRRVSDQLITGGQPTAEQLRDAAAEGFTTVINLATVDPGQPLADEAGLVRSLGLTYHHIPVEWENPRDSDFDAFEVVMQQLPPGRTLLHCFANYRVTVFYSLYALKHLGWSPEQAEAFRASIWQGEDIPAWTQFVRRLQARITSQPSSGGGEPPAA